MPNSLRCRIKKLCYQGTINEKDRDRLINGLDCADALKWIPVSERLPESDGCYLVTTTGTNNDIIDIAYYTERIWHKASRIKAWMPLPKKYEPQESEVEE